MAEIAHYYQQQLTEVTNSNGSSWSTLITVSSSNFTANAEYIFICEFQVYGQQAFGSFGKTRFNYNSTVLPDSEQHIQHPYYKTHHCGKFNAGATPANFLLEGSNTGAGANVRVKNFLITFIRVDADLEENIDFIFDEHAPGGTVTLTTSYQDVYTSPTLITQRKEPWLILAYFRYKKNPSYPGVQLSINGGVGGNGIIGAQNFPQSTAGDGHWQVFPKIVYGSPNGALDFKLRCRQNGGSGEWGASKLLGIRLNAFSDVQLVRPIRRFKKLPTNSTYDTQESLTFTPAAVNDYLLFFGTRFASGFNTPGYRSRVLQAAAVIPTGYVDDDHGRGGYSPSSLNHRLLASLGASSTTWDFQNWINGVANGSVYDFMACVFSLNLSSNNGQLSGTVREDGAPVSRPVVAKKSSDTSVLGGATRSDASTGAFKITGLEASTDYDVFFIDDAGGEVFLDKIRANVTSV